MDKKYIFGLAFAVLLLGSASAVAVQVALHGRSSVPVKGLTTSAAEQTKSSTVSTLPEAQPATFVQDFVVPVEKSSSVIGVLDVPTVLSGLVKDIKDAHAFRVEYSKGVLGYRLDQDTKLSLNDVMHVWDTTFKTAHIVPKKQVTADQVLYEARQGEFRIVVVLSRLTEATTGQSLVAMKQ